MQTSNYGQQDVCDDCGMSHAYSGRCGVVENLPTGAGVGFREVSPESSGARMLFEQGYKRRIVTHYRCNVCGLEVMEPPEILVGDESCESCGSCFGRDTFEKRPLVVWDKPENGGSDCE